MGFIKFKILILGALFLVSVFFRIPTAYAGSETKLFVPNQYAPLSSFQEKSSSVSETLTFQVHPKVVQFVVNNSYSGWVAHESTSGAITFLNPTNFDVNLGTVTLLTQNPGKYVIVAEPFTNDYPIVTHWKQTLNSGRGGHQLGASDAIGIIDYFPEFNAVRESTDLFDVNPANPYTFNTVKYALFSSDPVEPNARVPGFERYVGENYSVDKITDRLAVYFSLKAVETTGFPLVHRNHPYAFWTEGPANKQVRQNIPAFQVVHAVVISAEADKPSLSTFILPPNWISTPAVPYPVVFNGFYDINFNFAFANGLDFIKLIGDLKNNGVGSSIGILWNGGGALGSQTIQFSSYFNVAYLFEIAKQMVAADTQKIVTAGISRGGNSAINVAANPLFDNYRVKYALAYSSPGSFGEHALDWFSTNYPGDYANLGWTTGYKYSYQNAFTDSNTGLKGPELFLKNTTGSTERYFADAISPASDWIANSLKIKGTTVLLSAGTHDAFIPFDHMLRIYKKYVSAGVPVGLEVGYRFGHTYFHEKNAQLYWAMNEMMSGSNTQYSGIKHFRRAAETGPGFYQAVEFTPINSLAVSLPKLVWSGQNIKIEATGSAGLTYAVAYYKIDEALWNSSKLISILGDSRLLMLDAFSGPDEIQSKFANFNVPTDLAPGHYVYLSAISADGGANWQLTDFTKVPQMVDDRVPVFEVQASETTLPSLDINSLLNLNDRGWGLSVY